MLAPPAQDLLRRMLAAPAPGQPLLVRRHQQQQQAQQKQSMVQQLRGLSPNTLFGAPVHQPEEAACVLVGLELWLDELDLAHQLVQQFASPSGSFWHAILHRLEGDWSNGKYWYARCAAHPVLPALGEAARRRLAESDAAAAARDPRFTPVVRSSAWSGPAMVDLARALHDRPDDPQYPRALELQRLEWEHLLDYCIRAAVGRG